MRCRWGHSGNCRAYEKWEQVCGWMGQSGVKKRRESPRTFGGLEIEARGELAL